MTAGERGFLLLCSHLGVRERPVLTYAQLRTLETRMRLMEKPEEDRDLLPGDLMALGYDRDTAKRICALLEEEALLDHYLRRAAVSGCVPLTRVSPGYPRQLVQRLGAQPGILWAKGDLRVLQYPTVSLVGSREPEAANGEFAEAVGIWAARNGMTLVSGNARGIDRIGQDACLNAGGRVVSVVADQLDRHRSRENLLYLSEDGCFEPFSAQRALSRNRSIHAMGAFVFVAQCGNGKGGTWDGTARNLRMGWSPVVCFRDGSEASRRLEQMGAYLITKEELRDFSGITQREMTLF